MRTKSSDLGILLPVFFSLTNIYTANRLFGKKKKSIFSLLFQVNLESILGFNDGHRFKNDYFPQ